MSTSRRRFLRNAAYGAFAAGVTATLRDTSFARGTLVSPLAASGVDMKKFGGQLNSVFVISDGKNEVRTRLVEVVDLGSKQVRGRTKEAFSMLFRGEAKRTLPQGTYSLKNQELGSMTFLVVPILSKNPTAQMYEVVVNRLHD